ncbi:receptor kinase-like protein Xa21 isoform X3 [Panicum hallii]|uniref:receptor kinase-like protein Xa21 isoform X3 n=1 Tax=Panicum hallii TaxID=206008 RepID=UPI000DF4DCA8|nr:receptor kinase-like protein Xa21 isoform X3 [Panicum hallii]
MCDRPRRHVPHVRTLSLRSSRLLILVFLSSLSSFAVFPAANAATSSSSSNTDFETLLCLKLHLSNPAGLLGSWKQNDSLSFCRWPGVTCSKTSTPRVVALDLESSGLNGQIPPCIVNLTRLTRIHFPDNQLGGQIPLELGKLSRLSYLNLSSNNFNGSIPNTLSSTNLQVIDLGSNKLSGVIPEEVGMLRNLSVLHLARNSFTGNIPLSLGSSPSLVSVVLANNTLTGPIPSALATSYSLQVLNLVENNLGGDIPPALFNSTSLRRLNLGWNSFTGSIPAVSNLNSPLQYLTLSVNVLAGTIPSSLGNFSSLRSLLLAENHFQGIIPWRKRSKRTDHPSFMEMKNFSYADLVKATNGFSSDNLLGSGTYGSVYKGVLESEASEIVAIKVFKLDELGAPKSFVAECEAFRNTRHRNLVRVISACSTWDNKRNDFKALVMEYVANGTLESWIYSEMRRPLSLGSRVTIAVDIAAALDYLHNRCVPPIVHCDLKPSNVLLDDVMGARLSDFGLAKFLQSHNSSSITSSTSLAGPRGSIGYIAPEYGTGSKISTEGDVYSYGIIILEMLTGKRPTDELFNNGLSLQKFVGNAFPQKIHAILDRNIIPNFGSEGMENKLDHENNAIMGMYSCIMQLAKLGLSCSMQTPKDRPKMLDVYAEMSTIKRTLSALATMC